MCHASSRSLKRMLLPPQSYLLLFKKLSLSPSPIRSCNTGVRSCETKPSPRNLLSGKAFMMMKYLERTSSKCSRSSLTLGQVALKKGGGILSSKTEADPESLNQSSEQHFSTESFSPFDTSRLQIGTSWTKVPISPGHSY